MYKIKIAKVFQDFGYFIFIYAMEYASYSVCFTSTSSKLSIISPTLMSW